MVPPAASLPVYVQVFATGSARLSGGNHDHTNGHSHSFAIANDVLHFRRAAKTTVSFEETKRIKRKSMRAEKFPVKGN